jgi:alkaline phosphatase
LTSENAAFYIGEVKWRNQLLALFCLCVFLAFGILYFRYWVVQKPFGIIVFIGEGLDAQRLAATRIHAGTNKSLAIDLLSFTSLLRNNSANSAVPDAAAAATALATGTQVNNGLLGIDSHGNELTNLLELARDTGRMTGLVTDGRLTSITAAGFYAHSSAPEKREDLARQLVENADLDVVLGGGAADFLPQAKGGRRTDNRDLISEFRDSGYELVRSLDELEDVPRWKRAKLVGIFSEGDLSFRDENNVPEEQPSLEDMVRRSIELLQYNRGGYLLIVDARLLGQAAEEGTGDRALASALELDRAISVASNYAGAKSAIIVCADRAIHHNTIASILSPAAEDEQVPEVIADAKPDSGINVPLGSEVPADSHSSAPSVATASPEESVTPQSYAPFGQENDRAEDVLAFAAGLGTEGLHGVLQNTAIFDLVRDNL